LGIFLLNKGLREKFRAIFRGRKKGTIHLISRDQHSISRKNISPNALKVLYRLKKSGYVAYLVGGGVRDLLSGLTPKDFDVVTNGRPEEIRQLFANSRIIGRRFRLLHVMFPGEIIEVSTFRANTQEEKNVIDEGKLLAENFPEMVVKDNTYGTIEEDAWRRDFTVNALYYNIDDFSVIDFTGGMQDLNHRMIRMIGDPVQRYHEDPVRLLRAIRLAAKLNFKIHPGTEEPLSALSTLLQHIPQSRLFDELLKIFFKGNAASSYYYLQKYNYMSVLFPQIGFLESDAEGHQQALELIRLAMEAADTRFSSGQSLNPGFLLSVILWPALLKVLAETKEQFPHFFQSLHYSIDTVLRLQNEMLHIPRRLTAMMRSIWVMQFQLVKRRGKRVCRVLYHRYFRAAFDFLCLRVQSGEAYQLELDWWERFQDASNELRKKMIAEL